jgi:hypothetical protein
LQWATAARAKVSFEDWEKPVTKAFAAKLRHSIKMLHLDAAHHGQDCRRGEQLA